MGEIADMVLEGLLDEQTGEYIGDINEEVYGMEAPGFPITYEETPEPPAPPAPVRRKVPCPECGKRIKPAGVSDHLRDVHGLR